MHNDSTLTLSMSLSASASADTAALVVLRAAKRLHKAATGAAPSQSLPILRRVLATGSLRGLSLPELHKIRTLVRRKHILRTLAIEAGHDSWETYREALATMRVDDLPHFDLVRSQVGYPNLWFTSVAQAQTHATQHGGRVMAVGPQAVVFPENVPATWMLSF
jgi:hypothetical protein